MRTAADFTLLCPQGDCGPTVREDRREAGTHTLSCKLHTHTPKVSERRDMAGVELPESLVVP